MPKKKEPRFEIPNVDEMFSTQEMRDEIHMTKIQMLPISDIDPFPNHPFKVQDNEDMLQLVESVKERGVIVPVAVRKKEDGRYELISGHRRKRASELVGLETIPAEIKDLSRDEAIIMMVESNLQRTTILPSEKAFAYKMKLEAMKRQGQRTDLTSRPVGEKLYSAKELGKEVHDSARQIHRYIRLTELIPEFLEWVDEGKVGLRPAVELSYIAKEQQEEIYDTCQMYQCTPSHDQTIRMRKMFEKEKLTTEAMEAVMSEQKPNQKERLVLRDERVRKLIPKSVPLAKREDYIIKALEYYGKYRARKEQEQER